MAASWQYFDVPVGLYQGERYIGGALYYVKARNLAEAERKALREAEEHRTPKVYGPTFEVRVCWDRMEVSK